MRRGAGLLLPLVWALSTMALWAVAFYPAQAAPSWLLRTQVVCFGTTENGLPAPHGWILLVLAPASLLVGLIVSHGAELAAGLRQASSMARLLLGVVVAALVLELGWAATLVQRARATATAPLQFTELPQDYPRRSVALPDFRLVDQAGRVVDDESLRGGVTVVSFVFAHCATVCPSLVVDITTAMQTVGGGEVRAVLVTLDPWRDTPSTLASLAERWRLPEAARLLSGEVGAVEATLEAFAVPRSRDLRTGDVAHPALVHVVGRDGRIAYTFNGAPSSWLAEAARRLLAEASPS